MTRPKKSRTPSPASAPSGGRRAAARQAQQQAAAAAQRRKTTTQIVIVAVVALVAIGIVATAVLLGRRGGSGTTAPQVSTTIPLDGASVPFAIDGSAFRLGPADAQARVDLWVDYSCPHCQEFEATNNAALNALVAGGNVSVSYHNIQVVTDYGTQAGSAAACVAVHDAANWPTFNAALYANHRAETDGWSAAQFADFASQQGVNSDAQTCIREARYTGWITSNTQASAEQGIQGTPTMFLNGQPSELLTGPALTEAVESLAGR